jgi:hypothetical protein
MGWIHGASPCNHKSIVCSHVVVIYRRAHIGHGGTPMEGRASGMGGHQWRGAHRTWGDTNGGTHIGHGGTPMEGRTAVRPYIYIVPTFILSLHLYFFYIFFGSHSPSRGSVPIACIFSRSKCHRNGLVRMYSRIAARSSSLRIMCS